MDLFFRLENIGILKKAEIRLSGLNVIAGHNDQGKSTIGKALTVMVKTTNMARNRERPKIFFDRLVDLVFERSISDSGKIEIRDKHQILSQSLIKKDRCCEFILNEQCHDKIIFSDSLYIQTPLVWDLYSFFSTIQTLQTNDLILSYEGGRGDLKVRYPYLLWDLYKNLDVDVPDKRNHVVQEITKIIGGAFIQDRRKYRFYKDGNPIELENVAMGIKQFGILQVLCRKGVIGKQRILIFDEPENHLHPSWQIQFANLLVELSKHFKLCILINTHSPYMIEALYKYSKKNNKNNVDSNTHFYLAENNEVFQIENNNERTLKNIYSKLNAPFDAMDKLGAL